MNYPPPPPPPPVPFEQAFPTLTAKAELAAHQQAQLDWMKEHKPHLMPPPPVPVPPAPLPAPPAPVAPPVEPAKRINVRAKGQRGERQVVQLLQAIVDTVRNRRGLAPIVLQRNALQAHLGGEDIHGLDGFAVEVKWQENENVPAWWRQAVQQAERANAVPILFYRGSRQKWKIRFRAYVNTPGDRDQIEMDLDANEEDFVEWFGNAYDESLS
jgi:hypothetical protein